MQADYAQLKTELALAEYSGLSDVDAASHFNAKTATTVNPLLTVDVLRSWAASSGARSAIETGITNTNATVASICLSVRDFLLGGGAPLDLASTNIQTMIGALVQATVLTSDQQTSLFALQNQTVPYYMTVFGFPATDADIAAARAM